MTLLMIQLKGIKLYVRRNGGKCILIRFCVCHVTSKSSCDHRGLKDVKDHWAVPENIHTIRRTTFWNSEDKGGSLNWKSEDMGGYLRLEFRRHGGFRSGISTGDRQECIPGKS